MPPRPKDLHNGAGFMGQAWIAAPAMALALVHARSDLDFLVGWGWAAIGLALFQYNIKDMCLKSLVSVY